MQSCMIPFQLSPVAHRNIVRKAVPGQGAREGEGKRVGMSEGQGEGEGRG